MNRVIVTVKRQGETRAKELDVPSDVAAGQLAGLVARALRWDSGVAGQQFDYEIKANPPGRVLHDRETLSQASALDGSWLIFIPVPKKAGYDRPLPAQIPPYQQNDMPQSPDTASFSLKNSGRQPLETVLSQQNNMAPPPESELSQQSNSVPSSDTALSSKQNESLNPLEAVNSVQQNENLPPQEAEPHLQQNNKPLPSEVTPVSGWRTIGAELQPDGEEQPVKEQPDDKAPGFVWRKLD